MDEIRTELKEIRKNQGTILRRIEFLLNAGIIISGTYNARTSDSTWGKFFGILAVGLAIVCQIILVYEDIKEELDTPDDETEEDDDDGESELDE